MMKVIDIKKGQILQRQGDVDHKAYYVHAGLLRSYSIDSEGKEHIFMFAPEGWILADNTVSGAPAMVYIDALEDSQVTVRSKTLSEISSKPDKIERRLMALQSRILMLQSNSCFERYEHFLKTYANIAQRVPQRMIASYLGVTPETLSAAKRQHLRSATP